MKNWGFLDFIVCTIGMLTLLIKAFIEGFIADCLHEGTVKSLKWEIKMCNTLIDFCGYFYDLPSLRQEDKINDVNKIYNGVNARKAKAEAKLKELVNS